MKKTDSYSHILRYTGLFGGVQGLNILVGVVRNKLVAMILGPDGMGLISLFNSTLKLMSDSTNFGISISAVKSISEHFDKNEEEKLADTVKLVRSWSLLAGLLGMFLCIVLSPLLSKFTFSWDGHRLHFIFLSPIVALMALSRKSHCAVIGNNGVYSVCSDDSLFISYLSFAINEPLAIYA